MRIAIVEDEAIVAQRLERMVAALLPDSTIRVAPTLNAALDLIRSTPLELLFLDLNLKGRDGFQLLEEAAAGSFQTVVVSAHHDQALRAFDYGVTDFVAKPVERGAPAYRDRPRDLTPTARPRANARGAQRARAADDPLERHRLRTRRGRLRGAAPRRRSVHLHEKTLSALEALLPSGFVRVHRSYIVNMARARGLRTAPRLALAMDEDSLVPVGRVYGENVRERFHLV